MKIYGSMMNLHLSLSLILWIISRIDWISVRYILWNHVIQLVVISNVSHIANMSSFILRSCRSNHMMCLQTMIRRYLMILNQFRTDVRFLWSMIIEWRNLAMKHEKIRNMITSQIEIKNYSIMTINNRHLSFTCKCYHLVSVLMIFVFNQEELISYSISEYWFVLPYWKIYRWMNEKKILISINYYRLKLLNTMNLMIMTQNLTDISYMKTCDSLKRSHRTRIYIVENSCHLWGTNWHSFEMYISTFFAFRKNVRSHIEVLYRINS